MTRYLKEKGIYIGLCVSIIWSACGQPNPSAPATVRHMAQKGWTGSAGIYADRVPNRMVLKEEGGDSGTTVFYCLRVGIYDSTESNDQKLEAAKEKYFQLDMYKDWVLLNEGDTISPVFGQSLPQRDGKLNEQVVVYEIPRTFRPLTLIYKDPYKLLGLLPIMELKENNN